MSPADQDALAALEERIAYRFSDPTLLRQALTHRSLAHEVGSSEHYERLEFLGDAVLGLVSACWLFRENPELSEGDLARLKSYLVSARPLARYAEEAGLGELLRLSAGEERSGGRTKPSLLADALEALFAVVFLESGFESAREVVERYLAQAHRAGGDSDRDTKTELQERVQAEGLPLPEYRLTGETGPDHDKRFVVECWVQDRRLGLGEGRSKKRAEQAAASQALEELDAGR